MSGAGYQCENPPYCTSALSRFDNSAFLPMLRSEDDDFEDDDFEDADFEDGDFEDEEDVENPRALKRARVATRSIGTSPMDVPTPANELLLSTISRLKSLRVDYDNAAALVTKAAATSDALRTRDAAADLNEMLEMATRAKADAVRTLIKCAGIRTKTLDEHIEHLDVNAKALDACARAAEAGKNVMTAEIMDALTQPIADPEHVQFTGAPDVQLDAAAFGVDEFFDAECTAETVRGPGARVLFCNGVPNTFTFMFCHRARDGDSSFERVPVRAPAVLGVAVLINDEYSRDARSVTDPDGYTVRVTYYVHDARPAVYVALKVGGILIPIGTGPILSPHVAPPTAIPMDRLNPRMLTSNPLRYGMAANARFMTCTTTGRWTGLITNRLVIIPRTSETDLDWERWDNYERRLFAWYSPDTTWSQIEEYGGTSQNSFIGFTKGADRVTSHFISGRLEDNLLAVGFFHGYNADVKICVEIWDVSNPYSIIFSNNECMTLPPAAAEVSESSPERVHLASHTRANETTLLTLARKTLFKSTFWDNGAGGMHKDVRTETLNADALVSIPDIRNIQLASDGLHLLVAAKRVCTLFQFDASRGLGPVVWKLEFDIEIHTAFITSYNYIVAVSNDPSKWCISAPFERSANQELKLPIFTTSDIDEEPINPDSVALAIAPDDVIYISIFEKTMQVAL